MDGADLELFERSIAAATDSSSGTELDAALEQLGWADALADDPRAAVSTLFRLQGAAHATSSALGLVIADALGADAAGAGVVLPAAGRFDPPGARGGEGLSVDGLATAALAETSSAVVVARRGPDVVACTVPTSTLALRPITGVDPSLGLVSVTGSDLTPTEETLVDPERWDRAIARGRLALAHELAGGAAAMLALAREHALGRIQFGRTISSHQAVRHRLAESLVAAETIDAMIDAAWLDGTAGSAMMAKAVAGRESRTVARHCQQVLAGIGFTTEHPLHLYVTRRLALDALLGSAATLTRAQGEQILATGQLPPLLPL